MCQVLRRKPTGTATPNPPPNATAAPQTTVAPPSPTPTSAVSIGAPKWSSAPHLPRLGNPASVLSTTGHPRARTSSPPGPPRLNKYQGPRARKCQTSSPRWFGTASLSSNPSSPWKHMRTSSCSLAASSALYLRSTSEYSRNTARWP